MEQTYTFIEWLHTRATRDDIWLRSSYDEGLINTEERTISFGVQLNFIFKKIREELVDRFSRHAWYGDLINRTLVRVRTVNNIPVVDKVLFQDIQDGAPHFVAGVKRDIKALNEMVRMVLIAFPIDNDVSFNFMFEFFQKPEYQNLEGLNNKMQLLNRVFYILSHPIFFDYDEIFCFIHLVYDLYRKNPTSFCEYIQLASIGAWASLIINNHHPTTLNVLTCCLRYVGRQSGGAPIYVYPYHRNYEQTSSVVSYMRDQLRHRDDIATGTILDRQVMTWMLYHLSHVGVLPKLHYELMMQFGQDDERTTNLFGKPLVDLLCGVPFGLKYRNSGTFRG